MDQLTSRVHQFCAQFDKQPRVIWVAYSGGMDSHVLLHSLATLHSQYEQLTIRAIHINHQLQPQAIDWEMHCQTQCDRLGVPLIIDRVDAEPQGRQSPEEAAREARYSAFSQIIKADDILVTAHHQRDQAETFLLQLMRGSGLSGLSAMPYQRQLDEVSLYRPLLDCDYAAIREYAVKANLNWIEDPTNQDTNIRRNYIRHELIPAMHGLWPNAEQSIAQSATHLSNEQSSLTWLLTRELDAVTVAADAIDIDKLQQYPDTIQAELVRIWYRSLGLKSPGRDKLALIFTDIISSRSDANPQLNWQGSTLHRSQNCLLLTPQWPVFELSDYEMTDHCTTPAWHLTLRLSDHIEFSNLSIRLVDPKNRVQVNNQFKSLKRRFKEIGLPVLFRTIMPTVYHGSDIVLIPGVYHDTEVVGDYQFDFVRFPASTDETTFPLLSALGIN